MALASLQAAPLGLAAALFWAEGAWAARRLGPSACRPSVVRLTLALGPAFLPALFALVAFGHPSPLGLAGAYDARHVSVSRALALVLTLCRLAGRRSEREGRPGPGWLLTALALVALA
jgi:hypothetical protein